MSDQQVHDIAGCVRSLTTAMVEHPKSMIEIRALALLLVATIDAAMASQAEENR